MNANTKAEALRLLDEKYEPKIRAAIRSRGCRTVREIARVVGMNHATLWRMMRRLGYTQAGWQMEGRNEDRKRRSSQ